MKKQLIASFMKNGLDVEVFATVEGIELTSAGFSEFVYTRHHNKHGWYYAVKDERIAKAHNSKTKGVNFVHESAEYAKAAVEAFKTEIVNKVFHSLKDSDVLSITLGTSSSYVLLPNNSVAQNHQFFQESIKKIKKLDREILADILGEGEFDYGDYINTITFKTTFADYKKVANIAEEQVLKEELMKKEREFKEHKKLVKCILEDDTLAESLIGEYEGWVTKIEVTRSHDLFGDEITVRFSSSQYQSWKLQKELSLFDRDSYISKLHYWNLIDDDVYKELTGKSVLRDPNENAVGYFQCWECGIWQPLSKQKEDETCGC